MNGQDVGSQLLLISRNTAKNALLGMTVGWLMSIPPLAAAGLFNWGTLLPGVMTTIGWMWYALSDGQTSA